MAYDIGYVDDGGSEGSAHWQMLLKIKALAEANGWTTLRYDDTPVAPATARELILKGVGLSGTEEIFVGLRSYESVSADYYNLSVAGFTGYVDGNDFTAQPGYIESGIPAHNQRIDYWLAVNAQRIVFGMKVGTPVYEHGYVGKFLPYATPSQYPYPLVVGGMLSGASGTRFSDNSHTMPYYGNRPQMQMFFVDGHYRTPEGWPWSEGMLTGGTQVRDTEGHYPLLPIILNDANGVYGELDGVRFISGFNNVTENTVVIGGITHVVLQDVARNSFTNYIALEMN